MSANVSLSLFFLVAVIPRRHYRVIQLSLYFLTDITRWRRLMGSPKLLIIFHKRATKNRSLLQKMTYKDKGSYESSPPCTSQTCEAISCPVENQQVVSCDLAHAIPLSIFLSEKCVFLLRIQRKPRGNSLADFSAGEP